MEAIEADEALALTLALSLGERGLRWVRVGRGWTGLDGAGFLLAPE